MDKVNETAAALLGALESGDPKVKLILANSIWAIEGDRDRETRSLLFLGRIVHPAE